MAGDDGRAAGRWEIRAGDAGDLPFLEQMLYEAACWRPGAPRPPLAEVLADPHLARYLQAWGRPGDLAVVALEAPEAPGADARPVGAAWLRLFPPEAPGYGYVDAATPELAIAVVPAWRGRGVGSALLAALLARAQAAGVTAVSLSVERDNPALALYERHGFRRVGASGNAWTLRLALAAEG